MSFSDELTKTEFELPEFEEIRVEAPISEKPTSAKASARRVNNSGASRWAGDGIAETAIPLESPKSDNKAPSPLTSPKHQRIHARWIAAIPSWLVSTLVHVGALLLLAAISRDPIQGSHSEIFISDGEAESNALDDFGDLTMDTSESETPAQESEFVESIVPAIQSKLDVPARDLRMDSIMNSSVPRSVVTSIVPRLSIGSAKTASFNSFSNVSNAGLLSNSISGRTAQSKGELLKQFGGNAESEKAVASALKWLAAHQNYDGSWSYDLRPVCRGQCSHGADRGPNLNRNAATGMALLPFLGAGHTHLEGEYKLVVLKGITYLLNSLVIPPGEGFMGSWYGNGDTMYGHGIAAIAICEAYAMTKDSQLLEPSQRALNFISYAQNPDRGGWQYHPRQGSDTSVVAWQVMALKSGAIGNLNVSAETLRKTDSFLDSVQTSNGLFYGYRNPNDRSPQGDAIVTTACAVLCRIYMGMPKSHPQLLHAIQLFGKHGPDKRNMYYNYYATQVMKQVGGESWNQWNQSMRDFLVATQEKSGHMAGSWYFDDFAHGNPASTGGRLYFTAMSAMTLEVYYRYMPVYAEQTIDQSFKL